jgi:hypothetical protein
MDGCTLFYMWSIYGARILRVLRYTAFHDGGVQE